VSATIVAALIGAAALFIVTIIGGPKVSTSYTNVGNVTSSNTCGATEGAHVDCTTK
jgi:hypothetical protein